MRDAALTASAVTDTASVVTSPARTHLFAVDVLRLLTVLGVITVHATSLLLPSSDDTGAVLSVLHATREIFLVLSAAMLAHAAGGRDVERRRFWRRRYPLVAAPYVAWSAIYLLADGHLGNPADVIGRYGWDLLTGGARFHLYFLLLTFQLYLVFPWLYPWVRRRAARASAARVLLLGALGFQLLFSAAVHYRWAAPAPLDVWLTHPGSWLPSYAGYVVAGIVVGVHLDVVLTWVDGHRRVIAGVALGSVVIALADYVVALRVLGMGPLQAGEVFQPAVVIDSVALFVALLAVGLTITDRSGDMVLRRLRGGSDISFGVYLAHPLVIQGAMVAAASLGLNSVFAGLPTPAAIVLVIFIFTPAVFACTAVGIAQARDLRISLWLTGRPARAARAVAPQLRRWAVFGVGVRGTAVLSGPTTWGWPRLPGSSFRRRAVVSTSVAAVALIGLIAGSTWIPAGGPSVPRRAASVRHHVHRVSDVRSKLDRRPVAAPVTELSARLLVQVSKVEKGSSSAKAAATPDWVTTQENVTVGGLARTYLVVRPRLTSSQPLPVLMVLHGRDVTPQFEEHRTGFPGVTGPAILVYPAGYGESWNAGLCCSTAYNDHVDDVAFLTEVLHDVLRDQPDANGKEVYLAGYSNGGRMALTLACDDGQLFAGVSVYGATASEPCPNPRPTSVLVVASTGDPELTIGPGGTPQTASGYQQPTVVGQVADYRATDSCGTTSSSVTTGAVTVTTWECADHRKVGLALYQGGSHTWPAGSGTTPSAEAVMWPWLRASSLRSS